MHHLRRSLALVAVFVFLCIPSARAQRTVAGGGQVPSVPAEEGAAPTAAKSQADSQAAGEPPPSSTATPPAALQTAEGQSAVPEVTPRPPAATSPASVAGASPPAPPAPVSPAAAEQSLGLLGTEKKVDDLKDLIRRATTRLKLLSETVLAGTSGGRIEIVFDNKMSSAFRLQDLRVVVDNTPQYTRHDDTGRLDEQREIPVFRGSMPVGEHTVQLFLTFQGYGYGVFTYLRGYKFDVKDSHSITSLEGKNFLLTMTAFEQGGVTVPMEQRPQIRWDEKITPLLRIKTAPIVPMKPDGKQPPAGGVSPSGTAKKYPGEGS